MRSAVVIVGTLVALASCAEAGGEVKGGELTEAGASAAQPPTFSPRADPDAVDCGTGTKWSELYKDMFGPTQKPGSCSFLSSCHGPGGAGAKSPSGVECFDEKGCRASIIKQLNITPADATAPEKSNLIGVLRRRDGTGVSGIMPKSPDDYIFPRTCIDRVKGWLRDGAKDD